MVEDNQISSLLRTVGFYENLERDDEIMADRGFQIREELYHYFCRLVVPPGKRLKLQMTEAECKTAKEVANLRIHVEGPSTVLRPSVY